MNLDDKCWTFGFIIGAAATGLTLNALGIELHPLLKLAVIVFCGAGCGWLLDTLLKKKKEP